MNKSLMIMRHNRIIELMSKEFKVEKILPKKYTQRYNFILEAYGKYVEESKEVEQKEKDEYLELSDWILNHHNQNHSIEKLELECPECNRRYFGEIIKRDCNEAR